MDEDIRGCCKLARQKIWFLIVVFVRFDNFLEFSIQNRQFCARLISKSRFSFNLRRFISISIPIKIPSNKKKIFLFSSQLFFSRKSLQRTSSSIIDDSWRMHSLHEFQFGQYRGQVCADTLSGRSGDTGRHKQSLERQRRELGEGVEDLAGCHKLTRVIYGSN